MEQIWTLDQVADRDGSVEEAKPAEAQVSYAVLGDHQLEVLLSFTKAVHKKGDKTLLSSKDFKFQAAGQKLTWYFAPLGRTEHSYRFIVLADVKDGLAIKMSIPSVKLEDVNNVDLVKLEWSFVVALPLTFSVAPPKCDAAGKHLALQVNFSSSVINPEGERLTTFDVQLANADYTFVINPYSISPVVGSLEVYSMNFEIPAEQVDKLKEGLYFDVTRGRVIREGLSVVANSSPKKVSCPINTSP